MRCLNVGAGKDIRRGADEWINLDRFKLPGIDVVHDINNPFPFPENSFDYVLCSHVVEHLEFNKKIYIIEELHRIVKPSGKLEIMCPHWAHRNAYIDPTHLSIWEVHTFDYFVPGHWANYYSKARFKVLTAEIRGNEPAEIHWLLQVLK